MRDFARDWDSAIVRADFKCAQCGQTAARVALISDDDAALDKQSRAESALITESGYFGDWAQVVLKGGLRPVAEALAGEDAAALYGVDPLWAPFYCPECRCCYCHEHWDMRVVFDEDWTSWYDYTEATCPRGHSRMVDD